MAEDQIWVTKLRKLCFSRFFGLPEGEIYVKKEKEEGTDELTSRWFLRATTGHRGLPSCHVVRMIHIHTKLLGCLGPRDMEACRTCSIMQCTK